MKNQKFDIPIRETCQTFLIIHPLGKAIQISIILNSYKTNKKFKISMSHNDSSISIDW